MQYVLLATTLCSSGTELCRRLMLHPYIARNNHDVYQHPDDWKRVERKYVTTLIDELVYNHSCTEVMYRMCKFIYVVREADQSIKCLVEHCGYQPLQAVRYYCFRLRRLCEMAKQTSGLLLTADDVATGRFVEPVKELLGFKKPLLKSESEIISSNINVSQELIDYAQKRYEAHFAYLRHHLNNV